MDDLLHHLDTSEVSEHVSNRDNVTVLDERLGDILSALDLTSADGLNVSLDVHRYLRGQDSPFR